MKISYLRVGTLIVCAVAAAVVAYYGEPHVKKNADAILILTTVFTVFAGFLVAIIAVLGDPTMLPEGNWRLAEGRREKLESQLIVHVWLFVAYLLAIAFLFAGVMIRDATVPELIKVWVNRASLFLGVLSFMFTFGLAKSMLTFQMARLEAEIKRRRKEANLPD